MHDSLEVYEKGAALDYCKFLKKQYIKMETMGKRLHIEEIINGIC